MPVKWNIRYSEVTASTNEDALAGKHGDVFTAGYQTSGRGRAGHGWVSPAGLNLLMSAVLSVDGVPVDEVCTLPLAAGLSVAVAVRPFVEDTGCNLALKWPNDVMLGGRKLAGILCRRNGGLVIVGAGVNVREQIFDGELSGKAAFLGGSVSVEDARDAVLSSLSDVYSRWMSGGFAALFPEISAMDFLRGRTVKVVQHDGDAPDVSGVCGGINPDGSLCVGAGSVFSGSIVYD